MPAQPLTRDQWCAEFVAELLALRPDFNNVTKFAHQVAIVEYPRQKALKPKQAAWVLQRTRKKR